MNAKPLLAGMLLLAVPAAWAEEAFNPKNLPMGAVVRIVARRPPINLSRAEVVECATNLLTIRNSRDRFAVAPSNVLELAVLEMPPNTPAPDAGADAPQQAGAQTSEKKGIWEKIKALWQKFRKGKEG